MMSSYTLHTNIKVDPVPLCISLKQQQHGGHTSVIGNVDGNPALGSDSNTREVSLSLSPAVQSSSCFSPPYNLYYRESTPTHLTMERHGRAVDFRIETE